MHDLMKKHSLSKVFGEADGEYIFLGTFCHDAKKRQGAFAWSKEALQGDEWSPIFLPLSNTLWVSGEREHALEGLPGLIHDALPDGWGVMLQDKAFLKAGVTREGITVP